MKHRAKRTWLAWLLVWTMTGTTIVPYTAAQPTKAVQVEGKLQGSGLLNDGLRLYEDLEWDAAVEKFNAGLAAGLNAGDKATAYWYLAILAYADDNLSETENYMTKAFRAKPNFTPSEPVSGETLEGIFNRVSARVDRAPPQVTILPLNDVQPNQPIPVVAEISDKSRIVQVQLFYKSPNASSETSIAMKRESGNRWSVEIPAGATGAPGKLTLRVLAQDDWQNESSQPQTVSVLKAGGSSLLYIIGGAVVAVGGGVAALVLGGGSGGDDDDDDDDDNDTIPPEWPQSQSPGPPEAD